MTKIYFYIIYRLIFFKTFNFLPACDEGYHGTNCRTKCHFPWYGVNCMSQCSCSETDCNHVLGCVVSKEGMIFFFF